MQPIIQLAFKDLKLMSRDKMGMFFIIIFPVMMGIFFGLIFSQGNSSEGGSAIKVAIVDQDQSLMSRAFVDSMSSNDKLDVEEIELAVAVDGVRKGNRTGVIVIPEGFGETAGIIWSDEPPSLQVGADRSKPAESGMLEGFIMQSIGELISKRFQEPQQMMPLVEKSKAEINNNDEISVIQKGLLNSFFNTLESMLDSAGQLQQENMGDDGFGPDMKFVDIQPLKISREVDPNSIRGQTEKIKSNWDISFPQAMLWGVLGSMLGFAISIAKEETLGTIVRLKVAPISRTSILVGKALACFLTILLVIGLLTTLGLLLGLQLETANVPKLIIAALCIAFCFTGVMMVISVLGRTEQAVTGAGVSTMMIIAMLGGCMVPSMFLPGFMKQLSVVSPVRWGIQSLEGAIWREFSWFEMLTPCAVLLGFGVVSIVVGSLIMSRR